MSNNRELSQFASVITVSDGTKSVGIGSTQPSSKISVGGDAYISGVLTATSFFGDGSGLSGLSTFSGDYNDLTNTPIIPSDTGDLTNSVGFVTSSDNITGTAAGLSGSPNISVGSIAVNPDGDGFTFPTTDGSANQVLQTDGEGNISFATVSSGISNVVEDTTPQLGGNLDINGNDITGTGDIDITGNINISGITTASSFIKSGGTSSQFLKADGSVDSSTYITSADGGDADQLDGQEGTYYLDYNNFTNTPTIPTNNNELTNGAGYITSSDNITGTSGGLSGSPSITVTDITAVGNVSIAGTLTYEDVTSVDSIGIVTARTGVKVTTGGIEVSAGGINITGVSTFTGNINVTGTVDGRDISVDGSKLDGIESGATADQTASEILTAIKTVDGTGSGLDADLLDGQQGSYYLNTSTTFGGDVSGTYNAIVVADDSHNHIISNVDGLQAALDIKAPLASPALTGTPTAPTAAGGTNTTQVATTAFVASAIAGEMSGNAGTATTATNANNINVADESTDTTCNVVFTTGATGNLAPKTGSNLTFNSANGTLTATSFVGDGTGLSGITATSAVVNDTTPQLGGNLDINGNDITGTGNINLTGNITVSGTVDGRDVATDGSKLDGIESGATADQTASEILTAIKTVDGTGSGLDADTVDGIQASSFLRSDANDSFSGTITGNSDSSDPVLIIDGGGPNIIRFPDNGSNTLGIDLVFRTSPNTLGFEKSTDGSQLWQTDCDTGVTNFNYTPTVSGNNILTTADEGSGNGLDADTVDGLQASSFLRSDAADVSTGNIAFNGTLATFDPPGGGTGTDTATDVALALQTGHRIAGWNDGYIRTLLEWNSGSDIQIGQTNTSLIGGIDLLPGTDGDAKVNGNRILTTADEGSGNGIDADTVDGIQASSFLRSDANDTATGDIHITGTLRVGNNTSTSQPQFFIKNAVNASDADYNDAALMYLAAGDSDHNGFLMDLDDDDKYTQSGNNEFVFKIRTKDNAIADAADAHTKFLIRPSGHVLINYGATDQVSGDPYLAVNGNADINGLLSATTKSFVIDHPTKEGMKLRYGSLEGPENGVYVRGRLKDNNTIELPDYWTGLVHEDTITVNLTPIGKSASLHSVVDIVDNTVVVESANGNINCFYTVFGERKDVEKLEVEY